MTKIIAVANQKGGVGKTTCTHNLAAAKAKLIGDNRNVLMIDLDPQAFLTLACGFSPTKIQTSTNVCNAFLGNYEKPTDLIRRLRFTEDGIANLGLMPSCLELAEIENKLYAMRNADLQLRRITQELRREFEYIFIDCPPQLGRLLSNALASADEVIIPVVTEYLPYRGLEALIKTIHEVRTAEGDRSLNPDLVFRGIIANMYKSNQKDSHDVLEALKQKYVVLGVVKDLAAVKKPQKSGKPVVLSDPKSEAALAFYEIAEKL